MALQVLPHVHPYMLLFLLGTIRCRFDHMVPTSCATSSSWNRANLVCWVIQDISEGITLEDLVLNKFLKALTPEGFSAFSAEEACGISIGLAINVPSDPKAVSEPLPIPSAHLQDISELDELVVAGVQPNQEAVAQELLKRILLITGEMLPVKSFSTSDVSQHCPPVAKIGGLIASQQIHLVLLTRG